LKLIIVLENKKVPEGDLHVIHLKLVNVNRSVVVYTIAAQLFKLGFFRIFGSVGLPAVLERT
jgi:hypothetical protein